MANRYMFEVIDGGSVNLLEVAPVHYYYFSGVPIILLFTGLGRVPTQWIPFKQNIEIPIINKLPTDPAESLYIPTRPR